MGNVERFMSERNGPASRNAAYDHCFNYFRGHFEQGHVDVVANKQNRQLSSLHLGFYLASWGMFRGSAKLLQHSSAALVPVVELISKAHETIWKVDVSDYSEESIYNILKFKNDLAGIVPGGNSDTLTSKIMLGVFGCVPAFDGYFRKGSGLWGFNKRSLLKIHAYYRSNQNIIESCRRDTISFDGRVIERRYSQAKVIDMIFFIEGSK